MKILRNVLIIFLLCGGLYYQATIAPFRGRAFDKDTWDRAFSGVNENASLKKWAECIRGAMFEDLKHNYLQTGTPMSKVKELLGDGKLTSVELTGKRHFERCLKYDLGGCTSSIPDNDDLLICFGDKDTIIYVDHAFHSA